MERHFDIGNFVPVLTEETVIRDIAMRFRKRRKEKRLTQRELAVQSGVSYGSIRRFESTGAISLSSLAKIASVIGYLEDFDELFKNPVIRDLKDYPG
jgi:transcriptional regulator with XRE-family HTH domain